MSDERTPGTQSTRVSHVAAHKVALEQARREQNLLLGVAAGAAAALIGAIVWAVITVVTGYQIGFMAIGVGLLVAFAIRTFGKGVDMIYAFVGAGFALLGCVLGNVLAMCGVLANDLEASYFDVLMNIDLDLIQDLMVETFHPMDLLFYGIAVYEGFKLSVRPVTDEDRAQATAA